jgi:hypothetical protein
MRAIPHPITNCGADEGLVGSPKQGAAQNPAMKTPARLQPLLDEGLIDEVLRQLMSGKEAERRSFRQAVDYTENRKVKNWLRHVTNQLPNPTLMGQAFAKKQVCATTCAAAPI